MTTLSVQIRSLDAQIEDLITQRDDLNDRIAKMSHKLQKLQEKEFKQLQADTDEMSVDQVIDLATKSWGQTWAHDALDKWFKEKFAPLKNQGLLESAPSKYLVKLFNGENCNDFKYEHSNMGSYIPAPRIALAVDATDEILAALAESICDYINFFELNKSVGYVDVFENSLSEDGSYYLLTNGQETKLFCRRYSVDHLQAEFDSILHALEYIRKFHPYEYGLKDL